MLVSERVLQAMAERFRTSGETVAETLLCCLEAAQAEGGDRRGQQSAALLVVEANAGYEQLTDVVVDLRVDDHERPLQELRRIHAVHTQVFGTTPREQWQPVDVPLAAELRRRLSALGFDGTLETALPRFANHENLENRVKGVSAIDPVVLEQLRRLTADSADA